MILSAQDIQSQQFHVRFRGFDVEEVDDFLEKIAASFQAVYEENQKLKGRLETLEKDLAFYQNQQKSFQSAIIAAQNVADGIKEKSREEAETIVAAAQEEARLRREAADQEIAGLKIKIDHLKSLREQASDDLRRQLNSYLRMLETEPADQERAAEHFSAAPAARPQSGPGNLLYGGIPLASAPAETKIAVPGYGPDAQGEAELADLYVKIDIPDSTPQGPAGETEHDIALPAALSAGKDMLVMDEEEDHALPDLDGDMVFDLEDPLEGHEPEISFSGRLEEAKGKKTARFNPDESPL